ncbi:MAG: 50S ribosomal protein L3 [Deltaproteobacteria bacterium]|nr:50S ribosomal protein L3 [Candidatus Zymogenaceae bacterium]
MATGLIGKKLGMTQVFDESGNHIPVTVVEAGPCTVVDVRTPERNGYAAVALGFGRKDLKKVNKPKRGLFEKIGSSAFGVIKEFRISREGIGEFTPGQELTAEVFSIGQLVDVVGLSKGKGFAGVIKRWGFHGGRETHGSRFHRAPGSIGMCADPSRTFKGRKLPGHKGNSGVTVKDLTIVDIKQDKNIILIRGAVPGGKNGIVFIKGIS